MFINSNASSHRRALPTCIRHRLSAMPSRAAKEAARDEPTILLSADEEQCKSNDGYKDDMHCIQQGRQHGHQPRHRAARSNMSKVNGLFVDVISLAGNRIAEFHLSTDPTVGELMDAIASLKDGPPRHKQQIIVGERTFTHPNVRLLCSPAEFDVFSLVEQFIQSCHLNRKVASKLRLLAPHLQETVMKRGVGTSTLIGMRIHEAEKEASEEKQQVQTIKRALQSGAMMHAFAEFCEAELASFLHANFIAWRQVCKTMQENEGPASHSECNNHGDELHQSGLGNPLQVTLLIRHDCWPYIRVRPVCVQTHWCVIKLRILAADGTDILCESSSQWLSSSEPYDDSGSWGCDQVLCESSDGSFFHSASGSMDASWIQFHMQGTDWPAEIKVKQYARADTYATDIIIEGSADAKNFVFIASATSPTCSNTLSCHDEWTTIAL